MSELLATHGDHNVWSFFAFEEAATRAAGEEKDYEPHYYEVALPKLVGWQTNRWSGRPMRLMEWRTN
jgi:hypothetical protein